MALLCWRVLVNRNDVRPRYYAGPKDDGADANSSFFCRWKFPYKKKTHYYEKDAPCPGGVPGVSRGTSRGGAPCRGAGQQQAEGFLVVSAVPPQH